jgi:hypothetical protein
VSELEVKQSGLGHLFNRSLARVDRSSQRKRCVALGGDRDPKRLRERVDGSPGQRGVEVWTRAVFGPGGELGMWIEIISAQDPGWETWLYLGGRGDTVCAGRGGGGGRIGSRPGLCPMGDRV